MPENWLNAEFARNSYQSRRLQSKGTGSNDVTEEVNAGEPRERHCKDCSILGHLILECVFAAANV